LVFAAVPFLTYLVTRRRPAGFLRYVGLYRPEPRTVALGLLLALLTTPLVLAGLARPELRPLVLAPNSIAGQLRLLGPSGATLGLLLLFALVQTALAEEILFRGFLGQRLVTWLGFGRGNALQALLFGLLHLVLFATLLGAGLTVLRAVVLLVPPTLLGWGCGYLNVRRGNGSIVPGWLAHGLANAIAYGVIVFLW
jgi:membrane protease YdiL (CAAX protease family)